MSLVLKPDWRHFALIVLLASVVRGGMLFWTMDSLSADPDAYRRIAHCLTIHRTFGLDAINLETGNPVGSPTAFRPPLYPWLLSWLSDPQGEIPNVRIAMLHWLLGIATAAGTYGVAKRLLRDEGVESFAPMKGECDSRDARSLSVASMTAGILVAIDPLLLQSSSLVMTETVATLLVVITLWCWLRLLDSISRTLPMQKVIGNAGLTGIACGLAYFCRPTFVIWPLMLGIYLIAWGMLRANRRSTLAGGALLAVMMLFVGTWTARNYHHFKKPIWATTHGGYTLLLGNNPAFYEYIRSGDSLTEAWDASFFIERWERRAATDPRNARFWDHDLVIKPTPGYAAPRGEVADDRIAYETAMATIEREPMTFVRSSIWRLWRLHSPLPLRTARLSTAPILIVTAFYLASFAMVMCGGMFLGKKILQPRWAAGIALWVALASVHTIYWTDMRMRAPLVPVLAILAGACVLAWQQRTRKSRLSDRQS